jgi:hypothetical protein
MAVDSANDSKSLGNFESTLTLYFAISYRSGGVSLGTSSLFRPSRVNNTL